MSAIAASAAPLLADVAADLRWRGALVEAVQPWLPLWLRRAGYDAAGALDGQRILGQLSQPLVEVDVTMPRGDGASPGLPARLYSPRLAHMRSEATPLIFYVHGGGYALGSLASHLATCRVLASETGWRVLAVTYRRAPEHAYAAAPADVLAAYAHAAGVGAAALGLDARRPQLVLAGDSAGGQLVIELALRLRARALAGAAAAAAAESQPLLPAPSLLVPIYPVINSFKETASKAKFGAGYGVLTAADIRAYAAMYLGATADARARHASDAFLNPDLQADLSGLPPMLLVTAECDPLHDEGAAFCATARARGASDVEHLEAAGRLHGCVQSLSEVPSNLAFVRALAARMLVRLPPAAAAAAHMRR